MSYDYSEVTQKLAENRTWSVSQLIDLVSNTSARSELAPVNATSLLYSGDINGEAAWKVSEAVANSTDGSVGSGRYVKVAPDSILMQTELDALVNKSGSFAVDGLDIESIKAGASDTDALKNRVLASAIEQTHISGVSTTNLDAFKQMTPEKLAEALKDPNTQYRFNTYLDELKADSSTKGLYDRYQAGWKSSQEGVKLLSSSSTIKGLAKFGLLFGVLVFLETSKEAAAAELNGDSEKAKSIMMEWAVDGAGSQVGSIIGTAIGSIAMGALAAGGAVLSAPLAGALVFGASIVGAIYGADGAKELYKLTDDLDQNGRIDLFDKLGNLLFGADYTITSPLPPDLNGERLTLDTTFSCDDIVTNAKDNIAWRYALRELNPFVIPDIAYDRHNTDGSLDLYDEKTGQGTMTELYLQDRAAMLTWKLRYDKGMEDDNDVPHEGIKPYTEQWDTSEVEGNWDFVDLSLKLNGGAPLTLAIDGRVGMLRSTGKNGQKRNASSFHIDLMNQAANTPWAIAA